jgi:glucose/arabinose dehydrogenase
MPSIIHKNLLEQEQPMPRTLRLGALLLALWILSGCAREARQTSPPAPTVFLSSPQPAAASQPPPGTSAAQAPAEPARIALRQIAEGLSEPVYLTHAGDGSGRLFVVEKAGQIVLVRDGRRQQPAFLDIRERVGALGSEQGLLSVAFHPRYAENGRLFVNYTDRKGDTVISRFQARGDRADPKSEVVLLKIDQPYPNHNGGLVLFGPDGRLYIGMGDGGSGGDPDGNGQKLSTLLGKLLRIDVDGDTYAVPPDNPWAGSSEARGEIWAYGLRNPWRFSFDRASGDLYIADVGQNAYEEINVQPGRAAGLNYGWNLAEARHCFEQNPCDQTALAAPAAEYTHAGGNGCSVTGGYVYRGPSQPALQGSYFFGDYCSGRIWSLRQIAPGAWQQTPLLDSGLSISSFGEDQAGELYVTDLRGGKVYQLVAEGA